MIGMQRFPSYRLKSSTPVVVLAFVRSGLITSKPASTATRYVFRDRNPAEKRDRRRHLPGLADSRSGEGSAQGRWLRANGRVAQMVVQRHGESGPDPRSSEFAGNGSSPFSPSKDAWLCRSGRCWPKHEASAGF